MALTEKEKETLKQMLPETEKGKAFFFKGCSITALRLWKEGEWKSEETLTYIDDILQIIEE